MRERHILQFASFAMAPIPTDPSAAMGDSLADATTAERVEVLAGDAARSLQMQWLLLQRWCDAGHALLVPAGQHTTAESPVFQNLRSVDSVDKQRRNDLCGIGRSDAGQYRQLKLKSYESS